MNNLRDFLPFPLLAGIFILSLAVATAGVPGDGSQTAAPAPVVTPASYPTSDQVTAVFQQDQQIVVQLGAQLGAATPGQQQAIISNFQAQMAGLAASLGPVVTPPGPAQQAQADAQEQVAFQTWMQTLPSDARQVLSIMQLRQQVARQIASASPEQQPALIAQLQQLTTQQDQAVQAQSTANAAGSAVTSASFADMAAASAQAAVEKAASLPVDQQAELMAAEQRRQAFLAALQLPSDQQAAAMSAINSIAAPATMTSAPLTPASFADMAAASAQAVVAKVASLPADQQAGLLAAELRRQTFLAVLQLPPDQQAVALQAINNPVATTAAASTSSAQTNSTPFTTPNSSSP